MLEHLPGTQAYTEDTHYTAFTEPLLRHCLAEAHLAADTWGMRDEWLFEVDAKNSPPANPAPQAPPRCRLGQIAERLTVRRSS